VQTPDVIQGRRVQLRRAAPEDVPELRRIADTPEVRRWWPDTGDLDSKLDGPDEPRFTILSDDRVVGMIQCYENSDPEFRHAGMDIFLDPAVHGRGLGTEAIALLARWLVTEGGHHRLVIDPAADNVVAIRCYRKAGFQPVGVMRQYWFDAGTRRWRDGLLMDALADEILQSADSRE
jgi:aminoglycoside 6'-N-acetyltransferase